MAAQTRRAMASSDAAVFIVALFLGNQVAIRLKCAEGNSFRI